MCIRKEKWKIPTEVCACQRKDTHVSTMKPHLVPRSVCDAGAQIHKEKEDQLHPRKSFI